ncbi:hypothetical protein [Actinokineospora globicatena]|uniref:Lipoprotein n=1 Tax=Actinokineospora globicatena TaxID=103729 RepID=A0A9W6VAX2_9PSEU|nr:hypothetical protein [Actinokineospora globicatena]MCP2301537.1 hypothetical protein [Actinokineospora globicatena]GLW76816.1 hypothetical protein Aglo01_12980 [Actinokineospora globicatena]GLW83649.1 hypothetical protein Aglo02_12890 [Actinokineospora globicatena]GLW92403.1 hypothetical protein Aglo03_32190 [Actinokineospora globicatena]
MRALPGVLFVLLAATGCATAVTGTPVPATGVTPGRTLVSEYFTELNEAGADGVGAQREFLRRTQHPDFDSDCDLGNLTLRVEPALSTLRTDPKWKPEKASKAPRGTVYVVGVSVRIRRESATLAEQIGSQRVVVLDGKAYGFTPCPTR